MASKALFDTFTRDELQRARGEDSINGHDVVEAPVRECPVCGGPVPDDRRVTCSAACAGKRSHHRRNRTKPARAKDPVPAGNPPAPARASPGLAAAVTALLGALGELEGIDRVSVEVGPRVVTISRQ
jgi:predicted nucleic acid-binding Zn ribbon protein